MEKLCNTKKKVAGIGFKIIICVSLSSFWQFQPLDCASCFKTKLELFMKYMNISATIFIKPRCVKNKGNMFVVGRT